MLVLGLYVVRESRDSDEKRSVGSEESGILKTNKILCKVAQRFGVGQISSFLGSCHLDLAVYRHHRRFIHLFPVLECLQFFQKSSYCRGVQNLPLIGRPTPLPKNPFRAGQSQEAPVLVHQITQSTLPSGVSFPRPSTTCFRRLSLRSTVTDIPCLKRGPGHVQKSNSQTHCSSQFS